MKQQIPIVTSVLVAACLAACCCANGQDWKTVIRHDGINDPHDENWRLSSKRIQSSSGRETIDGKEWTYWKVADRGGEDGLYEFPLSDQHAAGPWRITLVARLVDTDAKGTGFGVALLDGENYWRLNLNKDGVYYDSYDGTAARFGERLDTTDDYHRYELLLERVASCDAGGADRVTLSIDGKVHARLVRRNFRRIRTPRSISFGSTNSAATGEMRYHAVEFATGKRSGTRESSGPKSHDFGYTIPQSAARQAPDSPWDIGSNKQLFIDRRFIEKSERIKLNVNPPVKRPGAVLESDKPWDAFNLIYYSIAKDGDVYKMWYQAYDDDQWGGGTSRMCYAVSQDGLHWEKPNLGLVEYKGSKENNILLDEPSKLGYVFIDPHGKPEQRFKMLTGIGTTRIRTSPDGIHWTLHPQVVWKPIWDTQKQAWWDPRIKKYVIQTRVQLDRENELPFPFVKPIESDPPVVAPKLHRPIRALGRLEVDDIMKPWPTENVRTIMSADEHDPPGSDIYHPGGVYQYPYASDAYFMFPLTYQHFRPGEGHPHNDGVNDVQFAGSRDGLHWMRYDRRPFIPRGLPGDPDAGMTGGTNFFVRQGNYLYQYYGGWPWTHGGFRLLSPAERRNRKNWGRRFIGVVVHRLDGFVSADAPQEGGYLITPPLVFRGHCLELNINVSALGGASVEIQDAAGKPIPGYSLADCDRILMNDVGHVVRWRGNSDVSRLAGEPIRLKIAMRAAKLHAFQFVSE